MRFQKDKRIGKVILVVEGGKHEFNLLKKIFVDILGYTQIEKRRGNSDFYMRKGDPHSVVAVVNARTSNIASIDDREYLETVFGELTQRFDFDVENAATYYLFDRDPESNTNVPLIKALIGTLKNSRENSDFIKGGMLILSYPAIEAYEISNFIKDSFRMKAKLGSEVKEYINRNAALIAMNKIKEKSILHAAFELERYFEEKEILMDLDDFSITNRAVFDDEENCLKEEQAFRMLSMFSCVLMDLGILER